MDTSVLQQFLDEGMLDIGDDDSRFNALEKTSEALFEKLTDDLSALAQYTLVALDPDISPEEPTLQQVEELTKVHWKTIRSRSADPLRQILRAVILNTLANFTDRQPNHVAIIWLMASSYFSFVRHTHQENSVEHSVITKAGEIIEKEAVSVWATASVLDFSDFDLAKLKLAKLVLPPINQEQLTRLLEAASGPNDQNGKAIPKDLAPNQHWPNSGQPWASQFAPKAATGIASVVDETNKSLQTALEKYLKDLNVGVTNYVEAIKSNLEQVTRQMIQASISASQRTNLLWWKESLYSPSIKRSYRVLPPSVAMLALAFDLSNQVSPLYPMSVDFFLKETATELLTHSNEPNKVSEISFTDLIDQLQSEINQQVVVQLLNSEEIKPGRISLVAYLRSVICTKNETGADLLRRVGVSDEQKITLPDFAVWCFRIFQAEQLIAAKVE